MGIDRAEPPGCLTTNEILTLAGVSRKQLDNYIRKGIVKPTRTNRNTYDEKQWTLEQVALVRHVPTLMRAGLTLEDIAKLADEGTRAVNAKLKAQYMQEMRAGRRGLKDIVSRSREIDDIGALDRTNAQYLRYIPQRWMAIAPVQNGDGMPGTSGFALLYTELRMTAETVGWSLTDAAGGVTSLSADGQSSSSYLYAGLASPPMPACTGRRVIDGGCYYVIDQDHGGAGCDGTRCEECARFGRRPTDAELFDWKVRRNTEPDLWEHTVMVEEMDEPYPTGMWSDYLKQRIPRQGSGESADDTRPRNDGPDVSERAKSRTVKPRLMPHEVKLPIGMTACVMPAGVYLCYQCNEGGQRAAYERIRGLASAIEYREFSLDDERAASENSNIQMERDNQPETGPVAEPFATSRAAGDPALTGWHHAAGLDVLRQLVVPTNMALAPEDGFCIVCDTLPLADRNDPARYEMQLLVDARKVTTPPPGA